ncbi:Reverse transcriptase (RNA-dependent DNA polymerase) [Nesidiocoris tenuis]|uniref:RNA-directed DNA polymerase n=1 Tax=Nesidiocoris tenuis TaxID=355587 RepID=A0ABN7AGK7_9HEMI|nr:Reverse transcriptase (RNA-dependent DNA polymerase) [Nesidiocoris tenuis]
MNDNGDSLTSGQATTDDAVSAVTIKLPPFWRRRPDLWFLQAESQFELRRITRERTKYNYVIGALDVDSMEQVSDIVSQPPGENCYEQMKAKLISIFSDSEEAKIRQLLQELELGDQKPSQLWRKMKDLAQNRLTDEILKTLWLQRLPTSVQQVLTGNKEAMTSLIITADRIVEITDSRPQVNAAVSGSNPEIARLVQAIENLHVWRQSSEVRISVLSPSTSKKLDVDRMDSAATIRDTSSRLFVTDRSSKRRFLIDTGSDVCVIPPSFEDKRAGPHRRSLYSVDNSPINTYGERLLTLDLGLRRSFRWVFLVANVSHPIIGADFLRFFNLLVDLRERKIVDAETRLATQPLQLGPSAASVQSVRAINQTDEYASLLREFSEITRPPTFNTTSPPHKTVHVIETAVSADGIRPLPDRINALVQSERPTTCDQLRRFLGTINYYRRFVKRSSWPQAIIHDYLAKKKNKDTIDWTPELENAYEKCKADLANATLLVHPKPDLPLILRVDASQVAVGAVLEQELSGKHHPLGFFSRKLTCTEQRYSTYDRELLAIYSAIKHFRYMVEGRTLTIFTDHKPLVHAFSQSPEKASPRQFRHLEFIAQFSTDIRHVAGEDNQVADYLSRLENEPSRVEAIVKSTFSPADIAQAQQSDTQLKELLDSGSSSLQLKKLAVDDSSLYCDISTGRIRPFVPTPLRSLIFRHFHGISHAGGRESSRLISSRFVWPSMHRDIKRWVRECIPCQKSKIQRHEKTPLVHFLQPDERFANVHIDVVGPLPPSHGHIYLLTCIDRYTRWVEAFPMPDQTAQTIADTFFSGWISKFGPPLYLVSDQGRSFESSLFRQLAQLLGIEVRHTTAYHPQCNGLIERAHRTIKAALMCRLGDSRERWLEELPVILLGLRTTYKPDLGASPAELVYGTSLRLPGEFFEETPPSVSTTPTEYIHRQRQLFAKIRPAPTKWHLREKPFTQPALDKASHVFLRFDGVRKSLQRPYTGPYLVLRRTPKTFTIQVNGKNVTVSRDRLKPAHIEATPPATSSTPKPPDTDLRTRSGRRVQFPDRFRAGL